MTNRIGQPIHPWIVQTTSTHFTKLCSQYTSNSPITLIVRFGIWSLDTVNSKSQVYIWFNTISLLPQKHSGQLVHCHSNTLDSLHGNLALSPHSVTSKSQLLLRTNWLPLFAKYDKSSWRSKQKHSFLPTAWRTFMDVKLRALLLWSTDFGNF